MKTHILLVDNNKSVLRSFSDAFIQHNSAYKCTCAENPDHARQILEFIYPDFIFINLDPEVGHSLEFVASLKKSAAWRKIKIVAYSQNIEYYHCISKAQGAHVCIPVPLTPDKIYDAINSFNMHTLAG